MVRTLYDIFIYIVEFLISLAFFNRFCKKKHTSNYIRIAIGLLLFIVTSLIFSFIFNVFLNILLFMLINLSFSLLCYKISLKDAIIYSILLDGFMFSSELLTIFLSSSLFDIPTNAFRNNLFVYIILSIISKLFYLALSQILVLLINRTNNNETNFKKFLPLFIFPILTIASSAIFIIIALNFQINKNIQISITTICILNILSCIFIFAYYQNLIENESKIAELITERNYYEINNAYTDILKKQNEELQMLFHDTKNHYLTIYAFDEINDVKNYVSKIYPQIDNNNNISISNNKILDLVLNKYIVICKNKKIKFNYEVRTSNLAYIDDVDLSIILNNIMDNAIESATKCKNKIIEFSLRNINDMDLLNVVNSCDSPPKLRNNQLLTTKHSSSNHGFGMKIIMKHVQKNNGKCEWFYDEIENKFHLTILFQHNNTCQTYIK